MIKKASCTTWLLRVAAILFAAHSSCFRAEAQETIDLQGEWELAMGDSTDYRDYVLLPGSLYTNDKLADGVPYSGKAWYRRGIYVPQSWRKQHVELFLERPYVETTVYVNGQLAGRQTQRSTPHRYDVSKWILPGQRNEITVCVNNSPGVGSLCNGITGRMELKAQPPSFYIKHVRIDPYVKHSAVHLEVELGGFPQRTFYELPYMVVAVEKDGDTTKTTQHFFEVDDETVKVNVPMGKEPALWDADHPTLYRMGIGVGDDYFETTFGMREFGVRDSLLYLNGQPLPLKGLVAYKAFPDADYPPMDEASWTRIFAECKEKGFNFMQFRTYCPPEAAFTAADKVGFYLLPASAQDKEMDSIVDTYSLHPSFLIAQ